MSIQLPDVHRAVVEVSVLHSPWTSNVIVQASADITEEDDMKLSWRPILAGLAAAAVTTTLSFGFGKPLATALAAGSAQASRRLTAHGHQLGNAQVFPQDVHA